MVLSILRLVGCCIYLGVLRRQPHRRSGLATMPSVGATIQYNTIQYSFIKTRQNASWQYW